MACRQLRQAALQERSDIIKPASLGLGGVRDVAAFPLHEQRTLS